MGNFGYRPVYLTKSSDLADFLLYCLLPYSSPTGDAESHIEACPVKNLPSALVETDYKWRK